MIALYHLQFAKIKQLPGRSASTAELRLDRLDFVQYTGDFAQTIQVSRFWHGKVELFRHGMIRFGVNWQIEDSQTRIERRNAGSMNIMAKAMVMSWWDEAEQ